MHIFTSSLHSVSMSDRTIAALTVAVNQNLPSHTLSLDEFVVCWSALESKDTPAAASLATVGVINDGEQISIDVMKYFEEEMAEVVEGTAMTRDYSSIHGFTFDLPYSIDGCIYVRPPMSLTLVQDNYITVDIVRKMILPLCRI